MKLYSWIDRLFDTKEKRRSCLQGIVALFWLWQYLWQLLFFFSLFQVVDYDTLFEFMTGMDHYTSSIFVNVAYRFISIPTVSFVSILHSVLNSIDFMTILFLALTLLWTLQTKKKPLIWFCTLNLLLIFVVFVSLIIAMKSTSLQMVIQILHIMAGFCLGVTIVLFMWLLVKFVHSMIKRAIKSGKTA